jgi:formamidopyrimidine-DNA glycosylase
MHLVPHAQLAPFFAGLGVEPLGRELSVSYLQKRLARKNTPIKNVLLDQRVVAGLGNIYAAEVLFDIKLDPRKKARLLSKNQLQLLVASIRKILTKAIRYNGTTVISYRRVDQKTGQFQRLLKVYGREGEPCPECGRLIVRIQQGQRSTFYCPSCQRR